MLFRETLKKSIVCLLFLLPFSQASADTIVGVDANVDSWFLGWALDHTYSCVNGLTDCYTFPTGSGTNGGNLNAGGTVSSSQANAARARGTCCASNMYYGIDGVCHQHTNQVLAKGGMVLNGATVKGYSISTFYFGTYGTCLYCN